MTIVYVFTCIDSISRTGSRCILYTLYNYLVYMHITYVLLN